MRKLMSPKFIKVIRDLKADKKRTALVFLALVLGLWSFSTVFLTNFILSRDLNQNFLMTEPPHAILRSSKFPALSSEALALMPNVSSFEFRDFSRHRIEVRPDKWVPLGLWSVSDFKQQSIAKLTTVQGMTTPPLGSIAVERNGLLISDFKLGMAAKVRVGKKQSNVEVSSIVFDPAQPPATQERFIYAYTTPQTFSALTGQATNNRLLIRFTDVSSTQQVSQRTEHLLAWFEENKVPIASFRVPEFQEHPHQWQLDTLLFMVGSIGFLSFLLSSVIVTQLMSSVMAKEIRQIGVSRAVGATRSQVTRMYCTYVLVISFASMLAAIPLAISTAYGFSYFTAGILNFEILTLTLPPWVLAILFAGAVFIPLVFSLPIILRGTNISVVEAMNDYGLSANKNELAGLSLTQGRKIPHSFIIPVYALRNTMRNRRMLLGTLLTMSLGVGIFGTGFNIRQSLSVFLANVDSSLEHDIQIVLNKPVTRDTVENLLSGIEGISQIELWNGGTGKLQTEIAGTNNGIGITLLPSATRMYKPVFESGKWISDRPQVIKENTIPGVVINQRAAAKLSNPELGATFPISFRNKSLNVKLTGIIREFDSAKMYIADSWLTPANNQPMTYNSALIQMTDNNLSAVLSARSKIEHILAESELDIAYVMVQAERVEVIYEHLNIILSSLLILAFVVLLVSALGMASAMTIDVINRTREIGILRALGATPQQITRLFEFEGLIVVFISILLGLIISYPLSQVASSFFGQLMLGEEAILELALSKAGIVITVSTAVIFGWLSCRRTAKIALTVTTGQALAYE
jgi:putative ABC transport system permease protein